MPRRYRSRTRIYRPLRTMKYNNQTLNWNDFNVNAQAALTQHITIVPPTTVGGVRKCKNFHLIVNTDSPAPLYVCLVYVPMGNAPSDLNLALPVGPNATAIYSPSQNIILSGMVQTNHMLNIRTSLARNLNAGDQIVIAYGCCLALVNVTTLFSLNFSISY